MGETATHRLPRQGGGRPGRSDKDRGRGLKEIPALARPLILDCARPLGHEALVVLMLDYYLRPEQAVEARLADDGLVVGSFAHPIPVAPGDRELLGEWLARRRRFHKAASVHTFLAGPLRRAVLSRLEEIELAGGPESPWRGLLRIGVLDIRRWARERFSEIAAGDEAIYHELCHDERAQLDEAVYLRLNARVRRTIDAGLACDAADIEAALTDEARRALGVIGHDPR